MPARVSPFTCLIGSGRVGVRIAAGLALPPGYLHLIRCPCESESYINNYSSILDYIQHENKQPPTPVFLVASGPNAYAKRVIIK